MSGLKIVLKLNRPKPTAPIASEESGRPAVAQAAAAPAEAVPSVASPVVAELPSATDGRSHGHKEKKEKKKHKHKDKHGERDRKEHAVPAGTVADRMAADGEPPRKKSKKHKPSEPGITAVPPPQHLLGGQQAAVRQPDAATAAPTATAAMLTARASPSVAAAPQPSGAAPVKLKLKAPKLLIKGSFGQSADSDAAALGAQPAKKKPKHHAEVERRQEVRRPNASVGDGPVSPDGGLEERRRRKKRRREGDQQQGQSQKPLMAGLITPSASEQGGGGGAATSTAHGGAVSGGLATPSSAAPASSAQVVDSKPAGPPERKMLDRVIEKLSKKDPHRIFQRPVTDEEAPGYSAMISRPMAFNTIRSKLAGGEYDNDKAWDDLQKDMETMFTNAMTYNPSDTFVHKQARSLLEFANKVVELGRQGVTDFRGRTNSIARAHNAAIAEEERQAREAQRTAERAAKVAERNVKMRQRAATGGVMQPGGIASYQPQHQQFQQHQQRAYNFAADVGGVSVDDTVRNTYHQKSRDPLFAEFKGLAFGTNADGMSWVQGRLGLQPTVQEPKPGAIAARLEAFARRLAGRAAELARVQLQALRTTAVA